jgi:hypothetical protein
MRAAHRPDSVSEDFFVATARSGRRASIALVALGATSLAMTATARADCIDDAARHHQVNTLVLRAIGWHESRLQPDAIGRNRNGTVDLGAFQINSIHLLDLAHFGVDAQSLTDGCVSAYVAAWHYRHQVDLYGNTWAAVGAYHSRLPARSAWYANRIVEILMRWSVLPPGALPFAPQCTLAPRRSIARPPVNTAESVDAPAHARAKTVHRVAGIARNGAGDAAAGSTRNDDRGTSPRGSDSRSDANAQSSSPSASMHQAPSGPPESVVSPSTLACLSPAR